MAEQSPGYDFMEAEARIRQFWEKEKVFAFNPNSKAKVFSIDNPPPTISGSMHIGHACMYSQMDFIVRYNRMSGKNIFFPFGTDDNGLPTERLVEKLNKVKSKSMSRQDFIELCIKTLKDITPTFIQDWKNTGISCDYNLYYSTIDKNSQKISQNSFIKLFKAGRAYKKDFPTIWCPECQTSIAQAELEDKELNTLFSTLIFKCNGKELPIATTRPELLPACVAVFVNPQDKRYQSLIGKKALIPLFNFEVPILADESADIEKGTGILMVCSYGDKYDAEAINRHKLQPNIVLKKDGTLNHPSYHGLKIKDARKKILEDLKNSGLIKEQKQITHAVNVHDKCGTEIEFLPTEQWFIKILDKKSELLEQGKKVKWRPESMLKRYENWVNGLEWDWNISRERHFGIPIPVWHCRKCNEFIIPEEKELPIDPNQKEKKCPKCKKIAEPETKVFDTWQTSSLTPEIISSLVKGKIKQPLSLRCNAHDIIRTWDFYTIAKSYFHENEIPWNNLMISGFVTLGGEKMSKSKGNVVEPQPIIKQYGADALRFWAASSSLGEDFSYLEKDIITAKKFITKLFNASKFAFMGLEGYKKEKPKNLEIMDSWILSELDKIIALCTKSFENYEYARVKSEIEHFFWHTFCDNYLEIVKRRVYSGTKEEKLSAQYALYTCLLKILKVLAPIMPYITEEIYQKFFKENEKHKSIHISSWPISEISDKKAEEAGELFTQILTQVRKQKSEEKKGMKSEIILTLEKEKLDKLKPVLEDLKAVTSSKEIKSGSFKIEFIQ